MTAGSTASAWIFKANPEAWRVGEYLDAVRSGREGRDLVWLVNRYADDISSGDRVHIWSASGDRRAGIVALARATGPVADLPEDKQQYRHGEFAEKYEGLRQRVPLRIEHILSKPLTKIQIQHNSDLKDALGSLSILRFYTQGTNYPVQPDEEVVLDAACLTR
jgi:EVE domain